MVAQHNMGEVECYNCHEKGHYASQCPNPPAKGKDAKKVVNMMMFTFSQGNETEIKDTCILLDSQSMVNVFLNHDLLQNICQVSKPMHIRWNSGVRATNLIRMLLEYGDMWYNKDGVNRK